MAGLPGSSAMVGVGPPLSASGPSLGSVKVSPPAGLFETISVFGSLLHTVPPYADPFIPGAPLALPAAPAPPVPPAPLLPWFQATVQLVRLQVPYTPPRAEPPFPPAPPTPKWTAGDRKSVV